MSNTKAVHIYYAKSELRETLWEQHNNAKSKAIPAYITSSFAFDCFWKERVFFSMQLSNGGCKRIGVKTPLASCSYHTDVPFHYPPIRITLQNLACFYSPVIGFILRCPLLWSSLLFFFLFHLPPLPSSLFLLWLQAPLYLFSPLLGFQ